MQSQDKDLSIKLGDSIPGSKFFKWYEVLYLNSWEIYCFPSAKQFWNIIDLFLQIDKLRTFLNLPMIITSGLRPRQYNREIKGSRFSLHMEGRAIDFQCKGFESIKGCQEIRELIKPKLEEFNLRMENISGNWIHIDNATPGFTGRFFTP